MNRPSEQPFICDHKTAGCDQCQDEGMEPQHEQAEQVAEYRRELAQPAARCALCSGVCSWACFARGANA